MGAIENFAARIKATGKPSGWMPSGDPPKGTIWGLAMVAVPAGELRQVLSGIANPSDDYKAVLAGLTKDNAREVTIPVQLAHDILEAVGKSKPSK